MYFYFWVLRPVTRSRLSVKNTFRQQEGGENEVNIPRTRAHVGQQVDRRSWVDVTNGVSSSSSKSNDFLRKTLMCVCACKSPERGVGVRGGEGRRCPASDGDDGNRTKERPRINRGDTHVRQFVSARTFPLTETNRP